MVLPMVSFDGNGGEYWGTDAPSYGSCMTPTQKILTSLKRNNLFSSYADIGKRKDVKMPRMGVWREIQRLRKQGVLEIVEHPRKEVVWK